MLPRRSRAPLALWTAFLGALPGSACAQAVVPSAPGPGGIVAVVNQDVITRGELDRRVSMYLQELARTSPLDPTTLERERPRLDRVMLDYLIEQRLLLQDSKTNKIAASDADVDAEINRKIEKEFRPNGLKVQDADEFYKVLREIYGYSREEYRDQVRDEILIGRLLWTKYFHDPFVTPGEMREYYRTHPVEFQTDSDLLFLMISVENTEEAARVMEALDAELKKNPFEDVAQQFFGARGQEMPKWRRSMAEIKEWLPPLPEVLARMKPGEVQTRIHTPKGWRYIKMLEVKAGTKTSFEEASPKISLAIAEDYRRREKAEVVARLRKEAHLVDHLPPAPSIPPKTAPPAGPPEAGAPGKVIDASPEGPQPKNGAAKP